MELLPLLLMIVPFVLGWAVGAYRARRRFHRFATRLERCNPLKGGMRLSRYVLESPRQVETLFTEQERGAFDAAVRAVEVFDV